MTEEPKDQVPYITYEVDGKAGRCEIRKDSTIGRRPENDIVLSDPSVSREHARIVLRDGEVRLIDSGSFNGTRVNGTPIKDYPLLNGDRIEIEHFKLRYFNPAEADDGDPEGDVTFTINEHTQYDARISAGSANLFNVEDAEALKRANEHLQLIQSVSADMVELMEGDALLQRILKIVWEIFVPDQAAILIDDQDTGEQVPTVTRQVDKQRELTISKTISEEVKTTRSAVLCNDLMGDERFAAAQSIISTGLGSTMCAPLIARERFLGMIYLTSFGNNSQFNEDGLRLLLGLANQAAVGIENNNLKDQIAEEVAVRNNLKRYVSAPLVDGLMNNEIDLNPGGRKQEVTCLFSDIKGFTTLSETLPAEKVVELLNEYFDLMVDAIFQYNGTLDKYAGDGIMAVWGNLIPVEDHAQAAVNAGLLMLQRVRKLNEKRKEEGRPEFVIRIGINTGEAVCGNIGSMRRMEYTVIGDTVNVAARLESSATPGTVLMSERTYTSIDPDAYNIQPHGDLMLKGKAKSIPTYTLNA